MDPVVLFDFGGTLDADGLPWKERFFRLYRAEGLALAPGDFDPAFYAADDALVGTIPPTLSLRDTVFRLARAVTEGLRPGDGLLAERVAGRFLADALEHLRRNAPLLSRLRGRYRLGIVSNFYGNLPAVCHNVGVGPLFSVIVDSAQVGLRKPDPRIFQRAVDELGTTPAAATFVGDSLARDMTGARAVGMGHIWLVGEGAEGAEPCCPGDPVIRSLEDLERVLS
jgi:putative hydrolase of the HAD superfamily